MPVLSVSIDPRGPRPIIPSVLIGDAKNLPLSNQAQRTNISNNASLRGLSVKGLLDTGATRTCIAKKIVKTLDLSHVGKSIVSTASHASNEVLYYKVAVQITHQSIKSQEVNHEGKVVSMGIANTPISGISIIEAFEIVDNIHYDVLIGMDIISTGLVILSGVDQRLTISF